MKSGIKNDPQDDPMLKSYIDPRLIRQEFGNLTLISQKLFQLDVSKKDEFIIQFFDYSVRTHAFVIAYCHQLGKSGDSVNKVAAEGLFKTAHNIKTLGMYIVSENKNIFDNKSKYLFQKYYLEINENYSTEKTLHNLPYVYNSWSAVCTACVYLPQNLTPQFKKSFQQDIEVAVEAGAPALIWYLSGKINNDEFRWQGFVDNHLRKYWNKIPGKKKML